MAVAQETTMELHATMQREAAGGSGFVWSKGKERPTDYLVDEKYYLDDAETYSKSDLGFVTNPDTSGNGYIKITLTKEKIETQKTATRWKGIGEISFDYNGNKINETDTGNNKVVHSK